MNSVFTGPGGAAARDQWPGRGGLHAKGFGQLFDPNAVAHLGPLPSGALGSDATVFPSTSTHPSPPPSAPGPPSKPPPAKRMRRKSQKLGPSASAGFEPMVDERTPTDRIREEIQIIIRFLVWEFGWPDFDEGTGERVLADARAAYTRKYPGAPPGGKCSLLSSACWLTPL
jgi:hypothetical protein